LSSIRRSRNAAVLAAGGIALALGLVGSAIATPLTGPFEVDDGTDSFAIKGYTYTSANATGVLGYGGNSSSTNATGVAGYVTSPLSVGVTGYAASTGVNAYGVYGYSNTGDGVYGVSNTSAAASIYGLNNVSGGTAIYGSAAGLGVFGVSTATDGVVGFTETSSTSNHFAGVLGIDLSSGGSHYGVAGQSSVSDGVYGSSSSGDGVYGTTTSGNGLAGSSASGTGAFGQSSTFYGVYGTSQTSYGTVGLNLATATPAPSDVIYKNSGVVAQSATGPGVYGTNSQDTGTGGGFGNTTRYVGVFGYGYDGPGSYSFSASDFGSIVTNNNSYPTLYVNSDNTVDGDEIAASAGNIVTDSVNFAVDRSGNVYASGAFTSETNTFNAKVAGTDAMTYSAQEAEATVEDFGSAQMIGGTATVALGADFRKTMDGASPYMVFLTPYGDNRGLYIASRSAAGFVVKEAQQGRASIAFDYRIVARPAGAHLARLPRASTVFAKMQTKTISAAATARSIAGLPGSGPQTRVPIANAYSKPLQTAPRAVSVSVGTLPKRLPQPALNPNFPKR